MARGPRIAFPPLEDHGLIGDCHSSALVSRFGEVAWWCPRRFDAASVFASILDDERGGAWRLWHPGAQAPAEFAYAGDNAILRTRWASAEGVLEVLDFMPPPLGRGERLVRVVKAIEGAPEVALEFTPRFDYGRLMPTVSLEDGIVVATGGKEALRLRAYGGGDLTLAVDGASASAEGQVLPGKPVAFTLDASAPGKLPAAFSRDPFEDLASTQGFWEKWTSASRYRGRYRGAVMRSAITLKLLSYDPTGAIVAAPTCSLPEKIGGVRNWDYRYSWVRDAMFSVRALSAAGHRDEAERFVDWLVRVAGPDPSALRVLYGVEGEKDLTESELPHLSGYLASRPVRLGNAAHSQFQLDVFGEVMVSVAACGLAPTEAAAGRWPWLRGMADFVAANWHRPDSGIWEVRSEPKHFVYSKAMAWATLERAALMARRNNLPGDVERWETEGAKCRAEALERGWSAQLNSFTQAYDTPVLDAANLLLPLIGFIDANDARMRATVDRTLEGLTRDDLVYRYRDCDDGLPGEEGTFTYCTFWLVEVLALQGRLMEARRVFERMLARASPLGLIAEEIDPVKGAHLGNFPQGFPHIGLIDAALRLDDLEATALKTA